MFEKANGPPNAKATAKTAPGIAILEILAFLVLGHFGQPFPS